MDFNKLQLLEMFDNKTIISVQSITCQNLLLTDSINTLVIVENQKTLEEWEKEQLTKIMRACKLNADNYFISDISDNWLYFKKNQSLKTVLIFGDIESHFGLNIKIPIHFPILFDNRTWIKSYTIDVINKNTHIKSDLWNNVLKKHYNV